MQNFIFDFDGTLADSQQCSVVATRKTFEEFGLSIPSEEVIEYYMGIPIEKSFKEMSERILTDEEFNQLLQTFRKNYKEVENDLLNVFPFIPEVLNTLRQTKKLLFVVSSKKSDVLLRNLQTLSIDHYFHEIIGSDKVTNYKPHPEGILKIVEDYQLNKETTIMIGDATFDLQMAKSAGVNSCGVTWGSHPEEKLAEENPTFLIQNVQDLLCLHEKINK